MNAFFSMEHLFDDATSVRMRMHHRSVSIDSEVYCVLSTGPNLQKELLASFLAPGKRGVY